MKSEIRRQRVCLNWCSVLSIVISFVFFSANLAEIYITEMRLSSQKQNFSALIETVKSQGEQMSKMESEISYLKLMVSRVSANRNISSSSLNLFSMCKTLEKTCTIGTAGNHPYWKDCATDFLPSEESVSFGYSLSSVYH